VFAPLDNAGRFTDAIPEFAGQQVFKANPKIIETLKERGVLLGHGSLTHSYPHCWRCKNPVIFRATEQWFVSMEAIQLRAKALEQIEERVVWIPAWGKDRIRGMIANRPDWCVSRQRVWGVPIPGFTCTACSTVLADPKVIHHVADLVAEHGVDIWFQRSAEQLVPRGTRCPCGGETFQKERDILDVWFESGVSYAAVLKPRQWWPASLYLEGSDQHRGWFHSALLCGVTTDDRAPYDAVLTHGFVVDGAGKKMSKSAGNVVAPQDVIKQSGAEIIRLWVSAQDYREDLRISQEILNHLIEAYRKIRNTCRFMLSNLYDFDGNSHRVPYERLSELDRWALHQLGGLIHRVKVAYRDFEFHTVFHEINNFCSVQMSAIYLDILKDRLYTYKCTANERRSSQTVLAEIVGSLARLMAPVLSFTSEEIWQTMPSELRGSNLISVHLAPFPEVTFVDPELEQNWEQLLDIRSQVQSQLEVKRRDKLIGSSQEAKVILYAQKGNPDLYSFLKPYEGQLASLFIVSQVELHAVQNLPLKAENTHDLSLGLEVEVVRAQGGKCERCWNYRASVGSFRDHPTLCDRCVEAVR